MSLGTLDHIVWATNQLGSDREWIEKTFGQQPETGGAHPGHGTCNELIGCQGEDLYLELIFPDPEQTHEGNFAEPITGLSQNGIYHWAARHPDLDRIHNRAVSMGMSSSGVMQGDRKGEDGQSISWQILVLGDHAYGALIPFFINWGDSPHPSKSLPLMGEISSFKLLSTEADSLSKILQAFDLDVRVEQGNSNDIEIEILPMNEGAQNSIPLPSARPFGKGLSMASR